MYSYILAGSTLLASLAAPVVAQKNSAGCGKALPNGLTPGGASVNITIESQSHPGGVSRQYLAHLPPNFAAGNDKAAPLIVAFHGQSQPAWSLERITGLSTAELNKDAIVVYPSGMNVQEPGFQWLGIPEAPPSSEYDDRIFVGEVLDSLTSSLCIDESRIYATGASNGGGLTGLAACTPALNKRFAAFAMIVAAFYPDSELTEPLFEAGCVPELGGRRLPMLEMHGLNDSVIAYDGNNSPAPNSIPIPDWIDSWLERNACSGVQPATEVVDANLTTYRWACGAQDDLMVHYKINNFGHGWPSTTNQGEPWETLRLAPTNFNATSVIIDWFSKWTL